ncbi:DUF1801 domain-containing protein [Flammeovirga pectinis]|uniref:DUF1801 domain-containing protein n=1 Tax=Flammeovirga pectinis TaxID=2494373 RepID=A0A3Q9FJI2_9BACT|nr:DUF1801 domain-containing protein [Flammeovirga pectinis]AZQ61180.1 DUF1801 domain-containing protein [Flammeovirga pectinis]
MDNSDHYYLSKEEPIQGCILALKEIIMQQDNEVVHAIKWGIPSFSFRGKNFCFISIDKKTKWPYLLFHEGLLLQHPELEQKDRKLMKSFSMNPNEDLPLETIELLINSALDLYKSGQVKTKK